MNAAVVVAAGRGKRMHSAVNKILTPLCGMPVIVHTVRALADTGAFDGGIVLVANPDEMDRMQEIAVRYDLPVAAIVPGGAERQDSVLCGLKACPRDTDIVAIHDGARPMVTADVVRKTLESAAVHGSGVAAVPVKDTIKHADSRMNVLDTPRRSEYYAVQTPQTFRYKEILAAYQSGNSGATDDAMLMEEMGMQVHLTEGDYENLKITTPEDLILAEHILKKRKAHAMENGLRIGHGYDVHRLVEGRKLILCGVEIPYEKGLLGHSDADVALHALMDAMLGAAAMGDIGRHFPDKDPAYEGADSTVLLDRVVDMLQEAGFSVGNVDVTIICQKPKLMPYIEQMRSCVASHLRCSMEQVSIKATTTEHLGFEGEGLGISTHAVALLTKG